MVDKKWKFREDMLGHYLNGVSNLTFQDAEDRLNYLENCFNEWNVILKSIDGNKIVPSKNNPKNSGQYLCTCIVKNGELEHRYLRIMEYDADKNYWHDIGNSNGISHIILAWKEQDVCSFNEFEYKAGEVFEKGTIK